MKKLLLAILLASMISSCASLDQSNGRKKMKKLNMYMNDHPDRDKIRF